MFCMNHHPRHGSHSISSLMRKARGSMRAQVGQDNGFTSCISLHSDPIRGNYCSSAAVRRSLLSAESCLYTKAWCFALVYVRRTLCQLFCSRGAYAPADGLFWASCAWRPAIMSYSLYRRRDIVDGRWGRMTGRRKRYVTRDEIADQQSN